MACRIPPEMLQVIEAAIERMDTEIRASREMEAVEVIALLIEIREPLAEVARRARDVDGKTR